jgi:hypothetical protein
MIQINCTKCQALLTLDDGFAGGTCRCRHCNAIQTVPRHLREDNGNGMATVGAKTQKLIYENQAQQGGPGSGSGIDELANIVASSGLSSSRLQKGSSPRVLPPTANKNTVLMLSIAGAVIIVLLGVIIIMAVRDKSNTGSSTPLADGTTTPKTNIPERIEPEPPRTNTNNVSVLTPASREPGFLGLPLKYSSVVYVLDNGQSASANFNKIREAALNSAESLGPTRKFQIILWDNGQMVSYPYVGTISATRENVEQARRALADSAAFGQSKADPAMKRAAESAPEAICLLAAKVSLPDDFSDKVLKALGNSRALVHTFAIGESDIGAEMKQVSGKTGGQHRDLKPAELAAFAR